MITFIKCLRSFTLKAPQLTMWPAIAFISFSLCTHAVKAEDAISSLFLKFEAMQGENAGKSVLYLRRQPVRVSIIGFDKEDQKRLEEQIVIYAFASGLPISPSNERPNVRIISASDMSRGGKLNPDAFKGFGISDEVLSIISQEHIWSTGCGIQHFRTETGSISSTIVIVDKNLPKDRKNVCLDYMSSSVFGVWGGSKNKASLPLGINPIRIAYILNVVSRCDRENAHISIDEVDKCIKSEGENLDLGQ